MSTHDLTRAEKIQASRAAARKPRDAAAVLFSLKFAKDIRYKLDSRQASKARLCASNTLAHCVRVRCGVQCTNAMYWVPRHYSDGRMTTKSLSKTKHGIQYFK